MTAASCKNCGNNFEGKYCNICGEKVYSQKDRSVLHILSEGMHFITHLEGTLFNTIRVIFTKPGKLSVDYCNGVRKKYFKPLSFFLLLVILYLLFPVFEGLNMKLKYHQSNGMYGQYAKAMADRILSEKQISEQQLEVLYHHAGEKVSKFLLFIIIPLLALTSWLTGFRKRKYYFDHFIFSIEMSSLFLMWGFLIFPFLLKFLMWIVPGFYVPESYSVMIIYFPFIIYTMLAAKRFFNFKGWYSILYAVLFSISLIIFLELIYKFILFSIAIRMV